MPRNLGSRLFPLALILVFAAAFSAARSVLRLTGSGQRVAAAQAAEAQSGGAQLAETAGHAARAEGSPANTQPKPDQPVQTITPPPGATVYLVKQNREHITLIARHFLNDTSFMTVPGLEASIRQANGDKKDNFFRKGDQVIIPGYEPGPLVEKPVLIPRDSEVRGIYLTGYTAGSVKGIDLIRRWKAAGGNAVVFDIKDFDGLVNVPFDNPLASTRSPLIHNLPKFARFLHSEGLHAIGRIALFRDAYQAQNHGELAVHSRRTGKPWLENGKLAWVDPSNPKAQDYDLALAKMVAKSGVDEIQFDYVRFPAEGDQKDAEFYFQSPAFQAKHPKWERKDVIADFLRRAYDELHPMGVLMSLDVFGVMAWQRNVDLEHTGQDIPSMAKYCDILSPMIYPSHFFRMDGYKVPGEAPVHFITESMDRFHEITADSHVVIRPWLQAFGWRTPSYSPAYVHTQVIVAKRKDGIGYLFWNARNDYSKVFPAMKEEGMLPGQPLTTELPTDRGIPEPVAHSKRAATKGK